MVVLKEHEVQKISVVSGVLSGSLFIGIIGRRVGRSLTLLPSYVVFCVVSGLVHLNKLQVTD